MRAYDRPGTQLTAYTKAGQQLAIYGFNEAPAEPVYPMQWVTMTTVLATFEPILELSDPEAKVWWEVDGVRAATGPAPTMDFGNEAVRSVRFGVTTGDGDRLDLVTTINLGYDVSYDTGAFMAGAQYNHPPQGVTTIDGLTQCTGLVRFLAEVPPHYGGEWSGKAMTGTLDFTGLSQLQFIDCFFAYVSGCIVDGCSSLVRLNLETCSLAETLDLNPVRGHLRDFRGSSQRTGVLDLVPLAGPMERLYHWCVHDQTVTNWPQASYFPAVEEWFIWNNHLTSFSLDLDSSPNSVVAIYDTPELTSINIVNQFPAGVRWGRLHARNCSLTSLDVTGCTALGVIDLTNNNLDSTAVDSLLIQLDSFNNEGGELSLVGNGVPTATGQAAATSLRSRAWTVTVEAAT